MGEIGEVEKVSCFFLIVDFMRYNCFFLFNLFINMMFLIVGEKIREKCRGREEKNESFLFIIC